MRVCVPAVRSGNELYVSPHFGRSPLFVFADVDREIKIISIENNPAAALPEGAGERGRMVVDFIAQHNVQAVVVMNIGGGAFYRLRKLGIKIFGIPRELKVVRVLDALRMLSEGRLLELGEPTE